MAKNRNVFAKRLREMEKKRKADEKRERRAKRKQADDVSDENDSTLAMSPAESAVLAVFRNHGKTAGQPHHFDGANVDVLRDSLELLVGKGLIAAEGSSGEYALTERGFDAISAETSPGDDAEP